MARKPRIHVPGGIYHVMFRGNNKETIFFDLEYYSRFYQILGEGVTRFGHQIHSHCLIPNHGHLSVEVGTIPLSTIFHNVKFRYAQWVNFKRDRKGHLFQGRFKAVLVKTNEQLLRVIRYIHLNPVKHGLVSEPSEYPWSSYRAFLGLEPPFPWHTTDQTLRSFGEDKTKARRRFAEFVRSGLEEVVEEDIFEEADDFELCEEEPPDALIEAPKEVQLPKLSLEEIQARVCRTYEISEQSLRSRHRSRWLGEARGALGWLSSESGTASLARVARLLDKDPSTLSVAARRFGERVRSSPDLRNRLEDLLDGILKLHE